MPALGGRIKIKFDGVDTASRMYMRFRNHARYPKMSDMQKTRQWYQTLTCLDVAMC